MESLKSWVIGYGWMDIGQGRGSYGFVIDQFGHFLGTAFSGRLIFLRETCSSHSLSKHLALDNR